MKQLCAATHESGSGPSRQFAAAQELRRFGSEADMKFGASPAKSFARGYFATRI
jgi:hypothetical protein